MFRKFPFTLRKITLKVICGLPLWYKWIVFEDKLENTLTANLAKERKVMVVMENENYNSRFIEKAPTMNMKKDEMISFMLKHDIQIPNPIPTKSVLLETILKKILIEKHYSVLRLSHYRCILNPIEMTCASLECLCK